MQDIADKLKISKNAVSLALNRKPGVSKELREAVKKAAEELNYKGTSRYSKNRAAILILCPDYVNYDNPFYYQIFWALERRARFYDFDCIILSVSKEQERKNLLPQGFKMYNVAGFIIVGVFTTSYLRELRESGFPGVITDTYSEEVPLPSVVTMNFQASFQLTEYIIQKGHRDIGFIGSISMSSSFFERWCGFVSAMKYYDLPVHDHFSFVRFNSAQEIDVKKEIADPILALKTKPTAWLCSNDWLALFVMKTLKSAGIRVPQDVSLAGFDGIEKSSLSSPPLTTYRVKREAIGERAIDLLVSLMKKDSFTSENYQIAIPGELVIRQSILSR